LQIGEYNLHEKLSSVHLEKGKKGLLITITPDVLFCPNIATVLFRWCRRAKITDTNEKNKVCRISQNYKDMLDLLWSSVLLKSTFYIARKEGNGKRKLLFPMLFL